MKIKVGFHLSSSSPRAPGLPSLLAVPGEGSSVLSDPLYRSIKDGEGERVIMKNAGCKEVVSTESGVIEY